MINLIVFVICCVAVCSSKNVSKVMIGALIVIIIVRLLMA